MHSSGSDYVCHGVDYEVHCGEFFSHIMFIYITHMDF